MKYRIAAVARMTDLSADVIRSWERRYGVVRPERDTSGLRLYSDEDVRRLTLAREATQQGHPIRTVAKLSDEELARVAASRENAGGQTFTPAVIDRILDALRAHDAHEAERMLMTAALLLPPERLALDVLAPVLRKTGDEWERGAIGVWQEHLLSVLVRNASGSVTRNGTNGDAMLFATPPFELHEFGIGLAAMIAAANGRQALNIGTGVPLEELLRAAERLRPAVVVVGMTRSSAPVAMAIEYAEAIAHALPAGSQVWIGGSLAGRVADAIDAKNVRPVATLEEFARLCR